MISACNVGTSLAGTGSASYGSYFQRGNNYGFATTGNVKSGAMNALVNASAF
jgi:hypothetical protein